MRRRIFRLPFGNRARIDAEMREEIDAHITLAADRLVREGMTPADAERIAHERLGALERATPVLVASAQRRTTRTERRESISGVLRDLAFGARQLRRSPGLTAGVALCLAFGIGASATVFSWMEGLVLRPLPAVSEIDRLVSVRPDLSNSFGISLPEFDEWRAQARSVSGLAAVGLSLFAFQAPEATEAPHPTYGMFVSSNYFEVLGVRRGRGRYFVEPDDRVGAPIVAVVSDALWRQRLGATTNVVGRDIKVNGVSARVVGIAPENFGGSVAGARFDIWLTTSARDRVMPSEASDWRKRDYRWLDVIGRLGPGTTVERAHAEFEAIGKAQAAMFVENRGRGVRAIPFDFGTVKQLQPLFTALVVVTGLVILLICSNVANLLLARAAARHRELAVRLSLGASRARLVRQLLTESALLALIGASLGAALAIYGHSLLVHLMPSSSVTIGAQSGIDSRFLMFVIGVTGGCVLAFGLVPALAGSRVDLAASLKLGTRGSSANRSAARTTLLVAQFALALSALMCAALFLRRDQYVRAMDLGFSDGEHVLLMQTEMANAGYGDVEAWKHTIEQTTDRVAQVPGVRAATMASFVPLGFIGYTRRPVEVPNYRSESGVPDLVLVNAVGPGYFDIVRTPLVAGRAIEDDDTPGRLPVAVVNEAFVARYFAGVPALGRSITLGGRALTIVGVAKNGKYDYRGMDDPPSPFVFYAWKQRPSGFVTIHARTSGDPLAAAGAIRQAMLAVEPRMTLLAPVSMAEYASVPFFPSRSALIVLAVLGGAALVLASMGLFSVISYGVTLRTREIGIRSALGATSAQIAGMFLRASLGLLARGLGVGLIVAALFTTVLRSKLSRLPEAGVPEVVIPTLILALAAIAAALIPARRAASVDAATTLRSE
jgi:predicted permease